MDLELALNELDRQLRNREPGRTFLVREGEARPREIAAYQRRHPQKRVIVRVVVSPKRRPGVPPPAPVAASPLQEPLGSPVAVPEAPEAVPERVESGEGRGVLVFPLNDRPVSR